MNQKSNKPRLAIIAGPTASGKTACAVEMCTMLCGEVISADSMQLYRGMDVLSASPTQEEMRGIKHHMISIADPIEKYTAARYRDEARKAIADVQARGKTAVLCGGTGLYINAVTRPMEFSQKCDPALRQELMELAQQVGGRRKLHDMLRAIDPESAKRLHENDVRRVSRAIEVYKLTGITQSEQARRDAMQEGMYDEMLFVLKWPREALYARIDARVDRMLEMGLLDEVKSLMAQGDAHPTAMQAIGYKEIVAALEGRMSMPEAISLVKQLSRNYAKKQMTWFMRDSRAIWIDAQYRSAESIASEMKDYWEGKIIR